MITITAPEKVSDKIFQSTIISIKLKRDVTLNDFDENLFVLKRGTKSHKIDHTSAFFLDSEGDEREVGLNFFGKTKNNDFFEYKLNEDIVRLLKNLYKEYPDKYFHVDKDGITLDGKNIFSIPTENIKEENVNDYAKNIKEKIKKIIENN
jgi:hypothetical protein